MKVWHVTNWGTWPRQVTSPKGDWVGIAIGPSSEEWLVDVDGQLLGAGQALPLVNNHFSVKAVRGQGADPLSTPPPLPPFATVNGAPASRPMVCEFYLFEDYGEMAAWPEQRPPHRYSYSWQPITATTNDPTASQFFVPFGGRREAHVFVKFGGGGGGEFVAYEVWGWRYARKSGDFAEQFYLQRYTQLSTRGPFDTIEKDAIVIGGRGDQAEMYDALAFNFWLSTVGSGTAYVQLDVSNVGEH